MARKRIKLCLVCGKEFMGTDGRLTCANACRTAMSRMLAIGKKPEYWLLAKSRGQKLPLLFQAPKPKREPKVELPATEISFIEPPPQVFDNPKIEVIKPPKKELTLIEKMTHNSKIDERIRVEEKREPATYVHPRTWKLQQDDIISQLQKQKFPI